MATFAERTLSAKNLIAGLGAHLGELGKRGITQEVITEMSGLYNDAIRKNESRNALKARSQEATAETEEIMNHLESMCSDAKKIVRMELPEETWPEFGFRKGQFSRLTPGGNANVNA